MAAVVLLHSVRKHMDPAVLPLVSFVALLVEGKEDNARIASNISGWHVCTAPLVPLPRAKDAVKMYQSRWVDNFTARLRERTGATVTPRRSLALVQVWRMTQFKRVLFMDADTLAVGDVSPALTLARSGPLAKRGAAGAAERGGLVDLGGGAAAGVGPFAAARNFMYRSCSPLDTINSGVFSLAPSTAEFDRLEALRQKAAFDRRVADQGLLIAAYPAGAYDQLPPGYNGIVLEALCNRSAWDAGAADRRVVHYAMNNVVPKPWLVDRGGGGGGGSPGLARCDGRCERARDVLALWWDALDEATGGGAMTQQPPALQS